jgi:hypothetical protein
MHLVRIFSVIGALGTVATGAALLNQRARARVMSAEIDNLAHRFDEIHTAAVHPQLPELHLTVETAPRPDVSVTPTGVAPPVTPSEPAPTPEETEFRVQEALHAQADTYARTFEEEPIDPEWSVWAEGSIQLAAGRATGIRVISAHCKSSLCKLDYSLEDSANPTSALRDCVQQLPWNSTAFNNVDTQKHVGLAYIAREGFGLPEVAAANTAQR